MRSRAARTVILADSSKIGRTALVRNGSLEDVDAFITDDQIDKSVLRELRSRGVIVIIARGARKKSRGKGTNHD
jgi:DeoR/GlpR family transcriptional regulator of sugar metabolism